jgi:hypothetical protein
MLAADVCPSTARRSGRSCVAPRPRRRWCGAPAPCAARRVQSSARRTCGVPRERQTRAAAKGLGWSTQGHAQHTRRRHAIPPACIARVPNPCWCRPWQSEVGRGRERPQQPLKRGLARPRPYTHSRGACDDAGTRRAPAAVLRATHAVGVLMPRDQCVCPCRKSGGNAAWGPFSLIVSAQDGVRACVVVRGVACVGVEGVCACRGQVCGVVMHPRLAASLLGMLTKRLVSGEGETPASPHGGIAQPRPHMHARRACSDACPGLRCGTRNDDVLARRPVRAPLPDVWGRCVAERWGGLFVSLPRTVCGWWGVRAVHVCAAQPQPFSPVPCAPAPAVVQHVRCAGGCRAGPPQPCRARAFDGQHDTAGVSVRVACRAHTCVRACVRACVRVLLLLPAATVHASSRACGAALRL